MKKIRYTTLRLRLRVQRAFRSKQVLHEREAAAIEIVRALLESGDCQLLTSPLSGDNLIETSDASCRVIISLTRIEIHFRSYHYHADLSRYGSTISSGLFTREVQKRFDERLQNVRQSYIASLRDTAITLREVSIGELVKNK